LVEKIGFEKQMLGKKSILENRFGGKICFGKPMLGKISFEKLISEKKIGFEKLTLGKIGFEKPMLGKSGKVCDDFCDDFGPMILR